MKKAGILTFHFALNLGAVLQCYALRKTLNSIPGISAEVINYVPESVERHYTETRLHEQYLQLVEKYALFRQERLGIRTNNLTHLPPETAEEYDCFITGSDQVWNPAFHFTRSGAYFLNFVPESAKKIAYAASIGIPATTLTAAQKEVFAREIPRFGFISLREKSYVGYIRQFTNLPVKAVVDPTLLVSSTTYEEILIKPQTDSKYLLLLLYFLKGDDSAPRILSFVNRISRKYGLKVVHFFTELPPETLKYDGGSFLFAGPEEFLGLMRHAEMIITNSFHGTAFSIIFGKPFYSFVFPARGARLFDLLDSLGLTSRIVTGYKSLSDISPTLDYTRAYARLDELRKESLDFLETSLRAAVSKELSYK